MQLGYEHRNRGCTHPSLSHMRWNLIEEFVDEEDIKDVSERALEVFETERRRAMIDDGCLNMESLEISPAF